MESPFGDFLDARSGDDLVLLYLSGHGAWSPDMGQLYFAAGDTHRDRLMQTGVPAEYVNDALEGCRARQKVLLLDCCFSGAFVQGFRTRGAGDRADRRPAVPYPDRVRGVYVITASDQRQHAYEGLPIAGGVQPSLFTGAVVDGLRTGRADVTGNGGITPDDLFDYVGQQLKLQSRDQSPTKSTHLVVGRIELARSVAGRPLPLRPLAPAARQDDSARTRVSSERGIASAGTATRLDEDAWRRLLDYYRNCLALEAANDKLLQLRQAGRQTFALWPGADEILVGDRTRVSVPSGTPAEALVRRVHDEGKTLAYGYPAVLLFDRQGDRTGKLAPLFTRTVEPFRDDEGCWHLQPVGAVMLHPALIRCQLGSDDADAALAEFEPGWSAGSYSQLAREATTRLKEELGLPTEPLVPTELDSELKDQHPKSGGRNAALLYEAPASTDMTQGVVEELGKLRENTAGFAKTALAVFARSSGSTGPGSTDETKNPQRTAGTKPFEVVTPFELNETQEVVLRSAMTRELTVATGPPGTGKSQLVANLVATAVAAGESVLVTSTNNRAVDVVWKGCNDLAPGLVIRTGSRYGERNYEQAEADCLRGLLEARPPDTERDRHGLRLRNEDQAAARDRCADKVRIEADLLELSLRRQDAAGWLGLDLANLPAPLAQDSHVERLRRRASSASRPWAFGGWRRRPLANLLGLPDAERKTCSMAAEFLEIETKWRRLRTDADRLPSDVTLANELRTCRTKVRDASRALVAAVVAAKVHHAQGGIAQRLQALQGTGSRHDAIKKMRSHLGAWAVTTHSARRLPLDAGWFDLVIVDEATQCSIPAVLPMLHRAKRVLIIGDPMQLTHITTCTAAQNGASRRVAGLGTAFLERFHLDFIRHSAFHAAAAAFGEPLMLDEHFRCHPEIIALPNRLFYGERLTVLTDPMALARAGNLARLRWIDVAGSPIRPGGGSWYNQKEVEQVREVVAYLRKHLPEDATIGVVTPFAAQKERLARALAETEARVGTVHTFQGGECDAMVLSLVGGPEMFNGTVDWLERSANLWNVAITRARPPHRGRSPRFLARPGRSRRRAGARDDRGPRFPRPTGQRARHDR